MKTGACPKCSGRDIYEIEEMESPMDRSANAVVPVTLTAHYGMYGKHMANARIHVGITAYVCATCAYSELYAKDLDVLERLAGAKDSKVAKVKR